MKIYSIKKSSKLEFYNLILNDILIFISILVAVIVFAQRHNMRMGLEGLFLLPISFAMCMLINIKYNVYLHGGVALKIFFCILFIRYNIVPLLIALTKGIYNTDPITMPMISASVPGYQYSVFISIVEIFVCSISLYYFGNKMDIKISHKLSRRLPSNLGVSFIGILGLAGFVGVLLSRDLQKVFSMFTFFTINEKYENASADPFGILAALVIKTFIFITITTYCLKKSEKKTTFVIIALIAGFFNMSIFFGYNRSFVLQTSIATIYVLYKSFPKHRKVLVGVLIPICVTIMISMIFIKQFGVSYKETTVSSQMSLEQLSNTVECYVGGPWSLASGYDAAHNYNSSTPIYIFLKDFIQNNFISYMPGLEFSLNWFSNTMSGPVAHQIYTQSYQMIPLSASCLFYGGIISGTVISILFYILVMKLLVEFDYNSKWSRDVSKKYLYTIIAVLISFIMCYTWITLLWSFTKNMFFLSILVYINQYKLTLDGKIRRIYTY